MPLPKPERTEKRGFYIDRCMAAISDEYDDENKAAAVCNTAWHEMEKRIRHMKAHDLHELTAEIFAVGTWNGMEFTAEDLKLMAGAFNTLHDKHQVPLKMGHNDEQPFTDGQPALGWVDSLFVEADKLMAKFIDMPKIVYEAMEKKLYKNVSIELDFGVEYKGDYFPFVLSGVALLGADLPAVNTLADLHSYMGRDISSKKRMAFTASSDQPVNGDDDMGKEAELQAQIDLLNQKFTILEGEKKTLADEKTKLEGKVKEFSVKEKDRLDAEEKAFFTKSRKDLETTLDRMVKEDKILPAQREKFMADFKEDKGVIKTLNYTVEMLDTSKPGKGPGTGEEGHREGDDGDDGDKAPDQILLSRTNELMAKNDNLSFMKAKGLVLKQDPELARSYADMNGVYRDK